MREVAVDGHAGDVPHALIEAAHERRLVRAEGGNADMVEIRLDLLGEVPDIKDRELLVTYRGPIDLGVLPEGFSGTIDIGEEPRPDTHLTSGIMSSGFWPSIRMASPVAT